MISGLAAVSAISKVVKKFLSYSEKNILKHKQIIINGFQNTIYFCSELFTGRRNIVAQKLEVKYNQFFNKNHNIPFPRNFKIEIRDELNNDVSKEIIELKGKNQILPLYKFTQAKGSHFTVEARGPFREDYQKLYYVHIEREPFLKNDGKEICFRVRLVFYSRRYPCNEVQYIQIPIQIKLPLFFFVTDVFSMKYIKLIEFLRKNSHKGRKLDRYKKTARQIYNVDVDKFENAVSFLYQDLSLYLEDNFNNHFSIQSDIEATIRSIKVSFASVFQGIPKPGVEGILSVDYSSQEKNIFYIDIILDKEKFISKSKRMWEQVLKKLPPEFK